MPRSGPRAVRRYSDDFKLTAVRLSHQSGLRVKTVAAALTSHPFMLSKWRKDVRDGGRPSLTASALDSMYNVHTLQAWPSSEKEDRFILLGLSGNLRVLLVVHSYEDRDDTIRIISARKATRTERLIYDKRRNR